MKAKRDNLVLVGAFAVAIGLHAVLLPWVGAAVGEKRPKGDLSLEKFNVDSHFEAGDTIHVVQRWRLESDDPKQGFRFDSEIYLSIDRMIDEQDFSLHSNESCTFSSAWFPLDGEFDTSHPLPSDADGPYFIIGHVKLLDRYIDTDVSNNTRVVPIYIDGPQRPELVVKTFNTPNRAVTGGLVFIDLAIDNLGDGWASSNPKLGEHGWADHLYLSSDDRLDATDLPLRTIERTAPLGPGDGYGHRRIELELPRGLTGPMHLILAADGDQVLDQPSFLRGFASRLIQLIDTDEPDLVVTTITNPNRLVIGRPAPIAFSIANIGSVPTINSNWVDAIYLSRDDQLDAEDTPITTAHACQPLQPRSRYETAIDLTLPDDGSSIEPGDWFLIVKADAANAVHEAVFEDNNTFAVPIEVWTQEQADAEIKLGDPDRPERLVVQWIENDRIEEHIALRSRTVQPALQSQAEPDPNAPLVDNPKPPAFAAADTATGDLDRPAQPTDPTNPNTSPVTPDAAATDVAPRPQAPGSPTQSKIDGLVGDTGTLNPKREGTEDPKTPDATLDPTPGTDTTPTPEPGEREVPSPADPNAPDTDRKTDSETPVDNESDTDSENPEKTETTTKAEDQTTDTTTTPKPDTEDAPKPEGDDGDPATPSEETNPTCAPKDESEAPPTDIKITELELQEGQVLVGKGIKITTKLPTPPGTGSRVLSIPRNARVSITFDSKGKVYEAEVIRSTTYKEWDAAIEASLYRWSAKGEAIDNAEPHVTIEWDYLLNDLFDEDE